MKRAIVLGGGGSCGAFQLGAWQALTEAGVEFDGFYGASIGAINAALMAQGDMALARRLWDNISVEQVMADGVNLEMSMQSLLGRRRELMAFLKKYAQYGGADIAPLVALCRQVIDEDKIRSGGRALGLMAVKFPSLAPVPRRLTDIPRGKLVDWLMASSACFPAFPMWQMEDGAYIDGGYSDNLPIGMALLDGARELVAVDLKVKPTHPRAVYAPYVTYIRPSWHLGGILMFDQTVIQRNKRMGYLDALKALGRLDGARYAFYPVNQEALLAPARRFTLMIARVEAAIAGRGAWGAGEAHPLSEVIGETDDGRPLGYVDRLIRGGEACAQLMGIPAVELYDEEALYREMLRRVEAVPSVWEGRKAVQFLKDCPAEERMAALACLYGEMSRRNAFSEKELRALCARPHELVAAIYLSARGQAGG